MKGLKFVVVVNVCCLFLCLKFLFVVKVCYCCVYSLLLLLCLKFVVEVKSVVVVKIRCFDAIY